MVYISKRFHPVEGEGLLAVLKNVWVRRIHWTLLSMAPGEKKKTYPINHSSGWWKTLCENFGNFAGHVITRAQTRVVQPQQRKAVWSLYFSANSFYHCLDAIYVTNQLTSGYRVSTQRSLQLGKMFLVLTKTRHLTTVLIGPSPLLVRLSRQR